MKGLITMMIAAFFSFNSYAVDAIHGMVIFGKENLYAYHLPMFHKIHNRQMVITFNVPDALKEQIVKLQDKGYLTFVPKPFDLDQFTASPFALKGDIYFGHFEKDGELVISDVTIEVPQILYLHTLVKPVENNFESYKVFGTVTDPYALHLINGGTAVDQIFKLQTLVAGSFTYAVNYRLLTSKNFLELNNTYGIYSPPGKCPSRLCGTGGELLASFKVESLYFTDDVM